MKKHLYTGEDFKVIFRSNNFKIGVLKHSDRFLFLSVAERHLTSREFFVLLSGTAVIYAGDDYTAMKKSVMKINTVYEVSEGEWHHITVSADATVLVIENADVSPDNTEKINLTEGI